ncbi:hypothetical protein M407DRAFT_19204 [Tulasnella calospora MUT 4182]|uniref:Uncharacterized protein n=1 Tax=Tulasnella calospora MUT 4182 TaxID=1051891 RepID=A0A0C3LDD5_9AGAM|nr:hypothetical protein M407DRAFT_19204 [Tulasnella calospora MUT 4182]
MSTSRVPPLNRRTAIRQAIARALRTTVRIHPSHPLCPEPSPGALRSALDYNGKGRVDVYRFQDRQVLAYYATLPSKKLYERLLNTEVRVYDWKWKFTRLGDTDRGRLLKHMEGLAEGANPLFALPEPVVSKATDGGRYGVIVDTTHRLPWEPLCLFPLLDGPGPSWTCQSRESLGAGTKRSAHRRSASRPHLSNRGTQNSNKVDDADDEDEEEEEEEKLMDSIFDLVPRGPPPPTKIEQVSPADRTCSRIFELERCETLGEAAFVGVQTSLSPERPGDTHTPAKAL